MQVGADRHSSKLTDGKVERILALLAHPDGPTQQEVAAAYGVSHVVIFQIANGTAWKHVRRVHGPIDRRPRREKDGTCLRDAASPLRMGGEA